jgi:hypothetical protein
MAEYRRWTRFMSGCLGLMLVAMAVCASDDVLPEVRGTPSEIGLAAGAATLVVLRFGSRR